MELSIGRKVITAGYPRERRWVSGVDLEMPSAKQGDCLLADLKHCAETKQAIVTHAGPHP
ncbi:hypothetical protein Rhe02_15650 [Rhizocola hellebori]|uniref:Uncharacterized protein n=1 Tax=Rhizocola hellebori TaxID=1392758 RepID=A0A8J3Q3Z0_9ACTN|nr:hypothetical protein [Rhizocola hellebori]GIH03498.1 hypothetical protein Rhe02_15650 [Rhizocola hellebori]